MPHWQTLVALGVVALTLGVFLFRLIRTAKPTSGGCGHGCGCDRDKITKH